MTNLAEWGTYWEVVGSAAGALTGLQFIMVALLADVPLLHENESDAADAFATPTIVHFVSALVLSALGAAPWHTLRWLALLWGVTGVAGLGYTGVVIRRMVTQEVYRPVGEDWLFHAVLPVAVYVAVTAAAVVRDGVILVAVAAVMLLLIGVHNAWDNVTFLMMRKRQASKTQGT